MKDSDSDFKVVDRRHEREPSEAQTQEASTVAPSQAAPPANDDWSDVGTEDKGHDSHWNEVPPPPADFTALVVSLASSAYLHLGEIPDPEGKEPKLNLEVARHTIDMLAMLRDKTKGNLNKDESSILERFLYDLRLKFVAAVERQ